MLRPFKAGQWLARQALVLLDQIPGNCSLCRRPCYASSLCALCRDALPWLTAPCPRCALQQAAGQAIPCGYCTTNPPALARCVAPLHYREPVDRLVAGLKFHARFANGRDLALLLADAVRRAYLDDALPEVVLPMPLHRQRRRQRGYNQALEIARVVCRELDLQLNARAVTRRRSTAAQTSMQSVLARQRNVADAFTMTSPDALPGCRHIAIVDDVITTMATANALADCLHQHGVVRVDAWCLARASRYSSDTVTEQLVNNRG